MLAENWETDNRNFTECLFWFLSFREWNYDFEETIVVSYFSSKVRHSDFHQLRLPACECWWKIEGSLECCFYQDFSAKTFHSGSYTKNVTFFDQKNSTLASNFSGCAFLTKFTELTSSGLKYQIKVCFLIFYTKIFTFYTRIYAKNLPIFENFGPSYEKWIHRIKSTKSTSSGLDSQPKLWFHIFHTKKYTSAIFSNIKINSVWSILWHTGWRRLWPVLAC